MWISRERVRPSTTSWAPRPMPASVSFRNAPPLRRISTSECDREPIRIPGIIQPYGCLIAGDAAGRICAVLSVRAGRSFHISIASAV
ncbi:hypothetical protein [Neorhizobium petrolearium]|uniref:hypothetical protein n=1 Tax=Neorhizobium petrolearium TaxID=515361 RepID=UPI00398B8044